MANLIEETRHLPRIVLIACGSFNPPTPMHFRMFEIAKDYFELTGSHQVVGGIVSPTHDSYGKKGLAPGKHRVSMAKLALKTSSWIRVSDWETAQSQWSRTQLVLQYHQNFMNNYLNAPNADAANGHTLPSWLPAALRSSERRDRVQLKLLCGADLLESFAVPGLWANQDIEDIVANHGLVVISRSGANAEKFIFDSDILTKYQRNITLVTNWVPNEVSSTMIRRLLSRGQSVKYLIDDLVLEYIKMNGLFDCKSKYLKVYSRPKQNAFNLAYINRSVNMTASSSNENTPSDEEADVDDHSLDEEERMDQTDSSYSIKNILTSINLDNRRKTSQVFCCGEGDTPPNKLLLQRAPMPGQAVQVITTESGVTTEKCVERGEMMPKKMKISAAQDV